MRRFYKTLNRFKKHLQTDLPVLVYIVKPERIKGLWGECYKTGKRYIIRIAKADWDVMTFVLVHELAHVLCDWSKINTDDYHDAEWGINYAKVWKIYVGE